MIDKNINYKDLAKYITLAIREYEFNNNVDMEGYSFNDLIYWLNHFGYCNANSVGIRRRKGELE